ncbi:kinase suppressor of ras [Choristoneura fumiferana]|uniref:kinase suppressor of ras n=1 Tax=Choristoneura fumiferana TaxID=7141 RepID=UPI003D154982
MEAESGCEIKRARDAVEMVETIQSMIDVSADRLEGLRTQCSTSAELTQQEIRTLEGKLLKHFSRQLVIKARFEDELQRALGDVPCLPQWLRVVGLSAEAIQAVCNRVSTLESLRERSDHELRAFLANARDEEVKRLCRAMHRLRTYTDALARGEAAAEMQLYWDSWERHARGSPRGRARHPRGSVPSEPDHATPRKSGKSPTTPVSKRKQNSHLPAPASLTKSRSHESQLSVKPDASDLSDNSQSSAAGAADAESGPAAESPPASPHEPDPARARTRTPRSATRITITPVEAALGAAPRSPRTPVGRCMAHDIAHRFAKTFNMIATCDYCDKQMLFGSGLKCKECKFKCHRDCESKVPPSCGLPPEFVNAFKEKVHKDGGYIGCGSPGGGGAGRGSFLSSLAHRPRRRHAPPMPTPYPGGVDSSSNTSSCNSSTPSSPAPGAPHALAAHPPHAPHAPHAPHHVLKQQFHFPEVKTPVSSPNHVAASSPARGHDHKDDLTFSVKSEGSRVSLSGSGSTDSGGPARADSLDAAKHDDNRWPRQNSLSMKEWDIPYDELKLFEVIGTGRFGTVYRGSWHGAVAVKLLHVQALSDHAKPLDTFKHEVATFRKTRHENLVLFMGACMKPPRLAIVTSLCKGMTLHTHIHLRKDKFNANKSVLVAQQISQGMGYLHARGIVHKDLKTKNIFLENGKVVITDFGLFSVTKLCFGNNARGDSLGIPPGWLCYLAPELVRALRPHASLHLPFSKATDVYAFGTVWYELLCGDYPFKGQPPEAVIWQVGRGVKQALTNMHASKDIKDILMVCWAYRPQERPDFASLLATLEKLPRKRLARSPSHPVHLSRSADSVF